MDIGGWLVIAVLGLALAFVSVRAMCYWLSRGVWNRD